MKIFFSSTRFVHRNISKGSLVLVLGILFVFLNGFIFSQLGVKIMTDSSSYLNYASQLNANGFYIEPHYFWYIQYPIFILVAQSIYPALETVVFLQYLLSFLALYALFLTSFRLFKSKFTAFITGLLYILFFEISIYNTYILCESYFISMVSISVYFLVKWIQDGFTFSNIIIGISVLLITVLIKPTGTALLGGIIALIIAKHWQYLNHTIWKLVMAAFLLIPFFFLINRMLATFGFIENYMLGEVVYEVSNFTENPIFANLTVSRPAEFQAPSVKMAPLFQLIVFIWNHPIYWMKLFLLKLFYYVTHIRPYWSFPHNLFSLVFLFPLYYFFILSFVRNKIDFRIRLFTIVFITINILSVCFLSVDWDGRFLLPILPIIFLLAAPEIVLKMQHNG